MWGAEMNRFCARHSTGRTSSSGSTVQPIRQPVIEKYLLKLLITTALGLNSRRRGDRLAVLQAVVDLVADQAHAVGVAPACDGGQLVAVQHGAGRVAGRGDDQAVRARVQSLQRGDGRLVARLRPGLDHHGHQAEGGGDVAVGRVVGGGHGDAVAGVEGRQEHEREGGGGAHRDGDPRRVGGEAVPVQAMRGDAAAQRGRPNASV